MSLGVPSLPTSLLVLLKTFSFSYFSSILSISFLFIRLIPRILHSLSILLVRYLFRFLSLLTPVAYYRNTCNCGLQIHNSFPLYIPTFCFLFFIPLISRSIVISLIISPLLSPSTLIKNKIKFTSYLRKFRWERLQRASPYMRKCANI